jgi:hypothetical protein
VIDTEPWQVIDTEPWRAFHTEYAWTDLTSEHGMTLQQLTHGARAPGTTLLVESPLFRLHLSPLRGTRRFLRGQGGLAVLLDLLVVLAPARLRSCFQLQVARIFGPALLGLLVCLLPRLPGCLALQLTSFQHGTDTMYSTHRLRKEESIGAAFAEFFRANGHGVDRGPAQRPPPLVVRAANTSG